MNSVNHRYLRAGDRRIAYLSGTVKGMLSKGGTSAICKGRCGIHL
jgi:hypothetical protein